MNLPSLSGRPAAAPSVDVQRTPTLPRVNLLPPEIQEAARFRRFQLAMVAAGVGVVAIVGALAYTAHQGVAHAQSDLTTAESQHAALQGQLTSLHSVSEVYNQVDAKKAMLQEAMGQEIRWSYYLNDLSLKIPQNVWLTTVTASEGQTGSAPGASAAASTTTVLPAGIGSVTFSGTAFTHDDVATWLDALAKERGFTNAYFSSSAEALIGPKSVENFTSSVTLTQAALSGRYTAVEG